VLPIGDKILSRLRAERRLGEMLAGMEKAKGGRGKTASTLEALSINDQQSHRGGRSDTQPSSSPFINHSESTGGC
jgi:hypothetical protein